MSASKEMWEDHSIHIYVSLSKGGASKQDIIDHVRAHPIAPDGQTQAYEAGIAATEEAFAERAMTALIGDIDIVIYACYNTATAMHGDSEALQTCVETFPRARIDVQTSSSYD